MSRTDNSNPALHIMLDKIVQMAREGETGRKHWEERVNNQLNQIRRLEDENREYFDALETYRKALRKQARGKKLPAVPTFHAKRVLSRTADDDIPF